MDKKNKVQEITESELINLIGKACHYWHSIDDGQTWTQKQVN